jgi:hemolysin activation/secretion protein
MHSTSYRNNTKRQPFPRTRSLLQLKPALIKSALIGVITGLVSISLHAEDLTPRATPADRELDLQNKQRQQEQINRQLDKGRQGSVLTPGAEPEKLDIPSSTNTGPKFLINTITIDAGDSADSALNIDDLLNKYKNRELGSSDLFALIRDATNRYAEKGFSTTTVSLVPKNMKQGIVELKINWGKVEGWLLNGKAPEGIKQKLMTELAMPGVVGKPLNIHQVDQMVENLNNAAKTARVDIQPSARLGYSYLNLITEDKGLPSLTLRGDNSGLGSPSNGRYRYTASTSISDLLLGNDTLGLNLSSRRFQDTDVNSEYNAGITYSLPIGFSKLDLRFNDSQYEKPLNNGKYGVYNSDGNSQTYAAKFSQVVLREKTQKLSLFTELEHKKSANYIAKSFVQTSSQPYTSLGFGLEHVTQLLGGSLYSDATFSHGLSAWQSSKAAYKDQPTSINGNREQKHFRKIEINTAWSRPFNVLEHDFNFSSRIGGQYSRDNLLTAEKIGLGDEFTVRGFKGPALWGDQGIYISNTVTMPLKLWGGTVSPLLGLDSGYARDVSYKQNNGGITGLAIGASGSWRYGGAALTLGVPLAIDDSIKESTDATVIYLSTYLTF